MTNHHGHCELCRNNEDCPIIDRLSDVKKEQAITVGLFSCRFYDPKIKRKYEHRKTPKRLFVAIKPTGDKVSDCVLLIEKAFEKCEINSDNIAYVTSKLFNYFIEKEFSDKVQDCTGKDEKQAVSSI